MVANASNLSIFVKFDYKYFFLWHNRGKINYKHDFVFFLFGWKDSLLLLITNFGDATRYVRIATTCFLLPSYIYIDLSHRSPYHSCSPNSISLSLSPPPCLRWWRGLRTSASLPWTSTFHPLASTRLFSFFFSVFSPPHPFLNGSFLGLVQVALWEILGWCVLGFFVMNYIWRIVMVVWVLFCQGGRWSA